MDEEVITEENPSEVQHKAIWITSCITGKEGLEITNLYGEFSCVWKDIVFATAVELERKGEENTFLLVLMLRNVDDIYYIDGKKINPRLFAFNDIAARTTQDSELAELWDAVRQADYRKSFLWLCQRIGSHLVYTYMDSPLAGLVNHRDGRAGQVH